MSIDLKDPRLTAYAFGELSGEDLQDFERLLETSPEARAHVDLLRGLGTQLRTELRAEPLPAPRRRSRGKIPLQGSLWVLAGLGVLVAIWLLSPLAISPDDRERKRVAKILLDPPVETNSELTRKEGPQPYVEARGEGAQFGAGADAAAIRSAVAAEVPAMRRCYESELGRKAGATGKIVFVWSVTPRGEVQDFHAAENDFTPSFSACVADRLRKAKLPPGAARYPVVFKLRE
jgi:hypothetical protein